VEQWTVCDGNTQGSEAPAQHHVIRSIITVAATATGEQPGHGRAAQHHPAGISIRKGIIIAKHREDSSLMCLSCFFF